MWLTTGLLYLTLPPSPDQLEHSYMGWRILAGDVPYRDIIDPNWPAAMWLHALATALFGNHLWSWRALDFLVMAGNAFFLIDLLRRTAGAGAAACAAFFYPIYYVTLPYWFAGQQDMSASHFLLGSVWFHVRAYENVAWRWQIGAGAFLAAGMLNKPTVGVLGPALALQAILLGFPWRQVVLHTATAAAAAVLALVAAFAVLVAQGASARDVVEATYTYNASLGRGSAPLADLLSRWSEAHFRWWPIFTLGALAIGPRVFRPANRSVATTVLPILWTIGVLSFVLQSRGYHYHLAACSLALFGMFAMALGSLWSARGWGRSRVFLTAVVVSLMAIKTYHTYGSLAPAVAGGAFAAHLARFDGGDGLTVAEVAALAERADRSLPSRSSLLVIGAASGINYLAHRPQPTRFYFIPVLIGSTPLPMAERWATLWEGEMRRLDSPWCLIATTFKASWLATNSRTARALRDALENHYRQVDYVGAEEGVLIYERQPSSGLSPSAGD